MSAQDNIAIARDVFEGWNKKDYDQILRHTADEFVMESDANPAPVRGREGYREFARTYLTAFPDTHFTIDDQIATNDQVVTRWTVTGTHKGELMGISPSGKPVEIHGCSVDQIRNGEVVRDFTYWDSAALLRQLGALPPRAD